MLGLPATLLATTALINFGLALFVYSENRTSPANIWFALFTLFLSAWSVSVLAFLTVVPDPAAVLFLKLAYASAALIAGSYYCFSLYFGSNDVPGRAHIAAAIGLSVLLALLLLIPGVLTGDVANGPGGREVILRMPDYLIFGVIFLALFGGGQVRLWWRFAHSTGLIRMQLLAVCASVTPIGLLGIYYNLILVSPFFEDFQYIWTGPALTSVFAIIITYSVFRYRLFSTKAIIAELLVFVLWLILFIRVLLSQAGGERWQNFGLLMISIPIGVLLLRSVRLEVETKERLALANTRLTELDRAKTEFLSIATHQLRSPITVIRGYAENLRDGTYGTLSNDALNAATHIAERGRALAGVVDDYLNVSRIELGRMQYQFQTADLQAVASGVVEEFIPIAKSAKLNLSFGTDGRGPYLAKLDTGKIAQVISNLIDNAIKYTSVGSIRIELDRTAQGQILLSVHDTGRGMDAATISSLFQKFSRATEVQTTISGTGLGLYVAAQLVSAHGGRIWAESEGNGRGSTFFVQLPPA
jgi:signal transduction histidine kinase